MSDVGIYGVVSCLG